MGDTLDENTQMGSLINLKHLNSVHAHVLRAVEQGAKVLCGGERYMEPPCDKGSYYKPTVLVDVTPDMQCFREEIFGPVLSVVKYKTPEEAAALANSTSFGLGANIFTEDIRKAYWLSKKIDAGTVWVNMAMYSQIACPFGGNKNSGLGREYGETGLHEYLKIKSHIWLMK
jgi:acyl-CoA reductase-like NAD-dependent aldehyde dehydrogenase